MENNNDNDRIVWVDYLKIFACILVVVGHLLQSFQRCGIDYHQNLTSFVIWFIYLFHMPLFMCLSGILYVKTARIKSIKDYKNFELKKLLNLLVPYFTFYLIYILINVIFSSNVNTSMGINDLIGIFNDPIAPYWFLYSLLSIFIVIPVIEFICRYNNKFVLLLLLAFKIVSFFFVTNIYFIDSILKWSFYFYVGIVCTNKENKKSIVYPGICFYIVAAILFYKYQFNISWINDIIYMVFAIVGIFILIGLFKTIKSMKILKKFTKYTMHIFLMHTIFAAGIRIVLLKFGIINYSIHLVLGLTTGLIVPIIVGMISDKIKFTNFFFYPINTIKELKKGSN